MENRTSNNYICSNHLPRIHNSQAGLFLTSTSLTEHQKPKRHEKRRFRSGRRNKLEKAQKKPIEAILGVTRE